MRMILLSTVARKLSAGYAESNRKTTGTLQAATASGEDKIVYCKDAKRPGSYEHESFDFLGYSFRPRDCRGRNYFVGFTPAVSKSALKAMSNTLRGWKLHLWSSSSLEDIASRINPVIRVG